MTMSETDRPLIGYWMVCGRHWTERCACVRRCAEVECRCSPSRLTPEQARAANIEACRA